MHTLKIFSSFHFLKLFLCLYRSIIASSGPIVNFSFCCLFFGVIIPPKKLYIGQGSQAFPICLFLSWAHDPTISISQVLEFYLQTTTPSSPVLSLSSYIAWELHLSLQSTVSFQVTDVLVSFFCKCISRSPKLETVFYTAT
jgi:hypothetical protein